MSSPTPPVFVALSGLLTPPLLFLRRELLPPPVSSLAAAPLPPPPPPIPKRKFSALDAGTKPPPLEGLIAHDDAMVLLRCRCGANRENSKNKTKTKIKVKRYHTTNTNNENHIYIIRTPRYLWLIFKGTLDKKAVLLKSQAHTAQPDTFPAACLLLSLLVVHARRTHALTYSIWLYISWLWLIA